MAELQISDSDLNYQYSGVFFLFEKCVIFSQKLKLDKVDKGKLDKVDKLQYRGHYDISNSEIYCGELNAFDLWDTKHSHMKFKFDSKNKSARILLQFLKKIVPESQFSRSPVLTKKGDTMWYKTKSFRKKISNAGFSLVGKLNGN